MQADHLDHRADLGLRASQQNRSAADPQAPGEHREVEHQRCIGEHQLAEIDDHVGLGTQRASQRGSPASLRGPILVAAATEDRRLVIEVDDGENLQKIRASRQVKLGTFVNFRANGHY